MARTHYEITVTFTYKNGEPGGVLRTIVNSKKAIDIQMDADRAWLKAKGHTINSVDIQPVNK